MARAYLTDMRMSRSYWYWATRHATRVSNAIPVKFNKSLTTPFELVYSAKPDYQMLFRLFCTAYFSKTKDAKTARTMSQAHTMQGIDVGYSEVANGMEIYNPFTKKLYTETVYRLDEHANTATSFNLPYDGGIFMGLVSSNSSPPDDFPLQSSITFQCPTTQTKIRGTVTGVPSSAPNDGNYIITLVDNSVHVIPSHQMETCCSIISSTSPSYTLHLPIWLRPNSKVSMDINGQYAKGYLRLNQNKYWVFENTVKHSQALSSTPLPNFLNTFQSLLKESIILPGWGVHTFASASIVSAATLKNPCSPTLKLALDNSNPDRDVWLSSYKEEFDGIKDSEVYTVISEKQYQQLKPSSGKAIPSMCLLTIKYKDGYLHQAKSRIVVLGNREECSWSRLDRYSPTLTQTQLRSLVALAVQHNKILKQGDMKNAFCNGILPKLETVIVRPPSGCPFSSPRTYWLLQKTLYGLCRSPKHWFETMKSALNKIGLTSSRNSPCVFYGTILPNSNPLYLGLYVDDFCYFSEDPHVEAHFEKELRKIFTVDFDTQVDWFLGQKFTWKQDGDIVSCHLSQEAFTLDILSRFGLSDCNTSPQATPFRSGLPVDTIPHETIPDHEQQKLTKRFQEIVGCLTWLSMTTCPDTSTITTMLSTFQNNQSKGHVTDGLYVLRYLASTVDYGITFTSSTDNTLNGFVKFPVEQDIETFADANWGSQDQSKPKPNSVPVQQTIDQLHSISGYIRFKAHGPISWNCLRQNITAQNSTEAEVYAVNEATKSVLELKYLFRDIDRPLLECVPLYNDNKGAVLWSEGITTKKMRHVDLQENLVQESVQSSLINIQHIPGKHNPSDRFTKELWDKNHFFAARNAVVSSLHSFQKLTAQNFCSTVHFYPKNYLSSVPLTSTYSPSKML